MPRRHLPGRQHVAHFLDVRFRAVELDQRKRTKAAGMMTAGAILVQNWRNICRKCWFGVMRTERWWLFCGDETDVDDRHHAEQLRNTFHDRTYACSGI